MKFHSRNITLPILNKIPIHKIYFQPNIGQEALERYIALEEEIAVAETSSPGMVLQQKREQVDKLSKQIQEQETNVRNLEAQT